MRIVVNGIEIPIDSNDLINIHIEVDDNGETVPQINIKAVGGRLDAYASRVKKQGNIKIHLIGEHPA